jgi:hypothetical protein
MQAVPAILAFAGTIATVAATIATQPKASDLPRPELNEKKADQELIDAQKRKGRQTLAGTDEGLLAGGPVGSQVTTGVGGSSQTLIGD